MAALDFDTAPGGGGKSEILATIRGDISQMPALIGLAVRAAIQVDKRVAASDSAPPVDRKAILARKDLSRAVTDNVSAMFITGYATAYRIQLARILWAGIADAPRRRLEELANPRA